MRDRLPLAAALALCLLLAVLLVNALSGLPDPYDRTVSVGKIDGGCVLRLHKYSHEIRPARECANIGRALLNVAGQP